MKRKITWLWILNAFIMQWFFIRLVRARQREIEYFDLKEVSITDIARFGIGGKPFFRYKQWYSIHGFMLPITGWRKRNIYLTRPWFIKITKEKPIKDETKKPD